jgi:hypothetical protein
VATATPVYLELIGQKFIDGGAGYNNLNLSVEVFHEVMDLWRISPSTQLLAPSASERVLVALGRNINFKF